VSDQPNVFAQLASNQKHERHKNHQETFYWCRQWRLLAEQAVAQLAARSWEEGMSDRLRKIRERLEDDFVVSNNDGHWLIARVEELAAQLAATHAAIRALRDDLERALFAVRYVGTAGDVILSICNHYVRLQHESPTEIGVQAIEAVHRLSELQTKASASLTALASLLGPEGPQPAYPHPSHESRAQHGFTAPPPVSAPPDQER
jgi:hypothetical protein